MVRHVSRQRRATAFATGIAAIGMVAAALVGCGTPSADAGDVADQIRSYAEQRLSLEGATVDSVDGDSAQFTMTPVSWSAPAAFMDQAVATVFARLVKKERPGGSVDSASCDDDVTATDAVTTRCTVTWSNAAGGVAPARPS